jgi:hypothetical protein
MSELVAQTYRILGEIARTETGTVFEAHDVMLDRLVAVKVALREHGKPSLVVEARRCAAVHDPCAVVIHGMGIHAGAEYVAGERVTGRLLGELSDAKMPVELYLARVRKLVAGVARAHDAGVPIGEISGGTVLVTAEERIVLGRLSLSQVPASPDVAVQDPIAAQRRDLHSLGVVALEITRGATIEPLPRLVDLRPDLPGELADLVEWLLHEEPAARPASAHDVLQQLDTVIERLGTGAPHVRVLIIDDDTARARWLWGLARRAHSHVIVEIAGEGTDAAHKLNRDQPDLVFVSATIRGVMNAFELCMYARGLAAGQDSPGRMFVLGNVSDRDRSLFAGVEVEIIREDARLPGAILERIRAALGPRPRGPRLRSTVSG